MKRMLLALSISLSLGLAASPSTPPTPTPPGETDFTASLAADKTEGEAPLQVKYTVTASEAASFRWFVNDRQLEADTPTLTYTFKHAEAFVVTVSATNDAGDIANASATTSVR